MTTKYQGWIYWGVCTSHLALARGYAREGGYFHDKAKNIRDKMSNLSIKNMMISKLLTTITIQ
jgi:hypothetical protein